MKKESASGWTHLSVSSSHPFTQSITPLQISLERTHCKDDSPHRSNSIKTQINLISKTQGHYLFFAYCYHIHRVNLGSFLQLHQSSRHSFEFHYTSRLDERGIRHHEAKQFPHSSMFGRNKNMYPVLKLFALN